MQLVVVQAGYAYGLIPLRPFQMLQICRSGAPASACYFNVGLYTQERNRLLQFDTWVFMGNGVRPRAAVTERERQRDSET